MLIRDRKYQRSWREIFYDFWDLAKERIETQMKMRRRLAVKRILAAFVLVVGGVYLLNAVVDLVSTLLNNSKWAGGLIVGIVLILIGVFISKK